ncbi:hypothetical protein SEA_AMORE2_102 [Gordonia phage Amore2]|nr:hypothetical protein SEA_AMORE2_102 [Gordonia phage Amore2]
MYEVIVRPNADDLIRGMQDNVIRTVETYREAYAAVVDYAKNTYMELNPGYNRTVGNETYRVFTLDCGFNGAIKVRTV